MFGVPPVFSHLLNSRKLNNKTTTSGLFLLHQTHSISSWIPDKRPQSFLISRLGEMSSFSLSRAEHMQILKVWACLLDLTCDKDSQMCSRCWNVMRDRLNKAWANTEFHILPHSTFLRAVNQFIRCALGAPWPSAARLHNRKLAFRSRPLAQIHNVALKCTSFSQFCVV